ncbi:mandelate racemase [Sulfitobacter alexandrii]|uniref:Mandelate racemase n=1 Tax=Sulfitobacter alexandrii TaxID=1917485 RepID=A0A1J0WHC0_9RHOB|nr:mandelate racemase/muconate lactonizing enzyme family protein [Sulfitobacter alexandrii]APE43526.1 mandelate racemase [Sulfitobacter alexandrii]
MNTEIAKVTAYPINIPVDFTIAGARAQTGLSCVVVEIETVDGVVGHGFTAITEEEVVAEAVNAIAAPALKGLNALDRERIAEELYWLMTPRGQTGYASHAVSCIDLALWDILGKVANLPCWALLGGARREVPLYVTFGFGAFDRDQLGDVARHLKAEGTTRFKMVVGHHGLHKRIKGQDLRAILREDIERVRTVRDAIGEEGELYIDANCSLDPSSARWLAERIADCKIAFFEEPVRDNDPAQMAELRRTTGLRIAAGQNEGQLFRFQSLLDAGAVDVLQPNAVICGGLTAAAKVAALAETRNVTLANGGAFPYHNMHLHAGMAHGGLVEWHLVAVEMCKAIFTNLPEADGETLRVPDRPGLGFDLDLAAVKELAKRPLSGGTGKA